MSRTRLPDRRPSETLRVTFTGDNGKDWHLLITVGFSADGRPREVFCSSFKVGTSLNAIVMDACILFSRLLQNGDDPVDIVAGMSQPHSLLGVIASAVADIRKT